MAGKVCAVSTDVEKNFTENTAGSAAGQCEKKELEAEIISVTFVSHVKVAWQKSTVPKPHWKKGEDVRDGSGSKRAAVYLLAGKMDHDLTVEIKVTKSKNVSGPAMLQGRLKDLNVEGQCPVSVGTHVVKCILKKPPDRMLWYQGDMNWLLSVLDYANISLESTRVELFFVLDTPISVYQGGKGVWVEALRLLHEEVSITNIKDEKIAAGAITRYCHRRGLKYDTLEGRNQYNVHGDGGDFWLDKYLKKTKPKCNCYDQAAGVQALCGAVGVKTKWLYLEPFGFIKKTQLVGIGQCNNPFYTATGSTPIVSANDPRRTDFGNHAFCESSGQVLDGCAGPHDGSEDRSGYVDHSIEKTSDTTLYTTRGSSPGTAGIIDDTPGGITNVS